VRERPVERVGDELAGGRGFARALEEGRITVVSENGAWVERDDALERTVEFDGFREAIDFVGRLADLAESENHHPDIAISYRRVTIRWTTHSAGGITDRDRELAARTDELL
jgi:4a-hydroxytetrahydrobiopterin dehydratase